MPDKDEEELTPEESAAVEAASAVSGLETATKRRSAAPDSSDELEETRKALRQAVVNQRIGIGDADAILREFQRAAKWGLPLPDLERTIEGVTLGAHDKFYQRAKQSFNAFFQNAINQPLIIRRAASLDSPTMRAVYDTALETVNALKGVLDDQYLLWLFDQEAMTQAVVQSLGGVSEQVQTGPIDYLREQLPFLLPNMFPSFQGRDAAADIVMAFETAAARRVQENSQRKTFRAQLAQLRARLNDFPDAQFRIDEAANPWEDDYVDRGIPLGKTPLDFLGDVLPGVLAASTRDTPVYFPIPAGDASGAVTALASSGEFGVFLARARARLLAEDVPPTDAFSFEVMQRMFEQAGRNQGTASIIFGDYLKAWQAQHPPVAPDLPLMPVRLLPEDERRLRQMGVPLPPGFMSNFPPPTPQQAAQIEALRAEAPQRAALDFQRGQLEEINRNLAAAGTEVPPELEEQRRLSQGEVDRLSKLFPQEQTEEEENTLRAFEGVPDAVIGKIRRGENLVGEEAVRFGGSARPELHQVLAPRLDAGQRLESRISQGLYDDPMVLEALRLAHEGRRLAEKQLEEARAVPQAQRTQADVDRIIDLMQVKIPDIDREIERLSGSGQSPTSQLLPQPVQPPRIIPGIAARVRF